MAAAGEKRETFADGVARVRLGKNAPTAGDNGIGSKHLRRSFGPGACNQLRFGNRQPKRMGARRFVFQRRFVDLRRYDRVGDNAGLREQRLAARTFACQHEQNARTI